MKSKKYKHIYKLGQGGNGVVWKVINGKREVFAKKILKNVNDTKAYQRFKDEVFVITKNPHEGIMNILDYHLPDKYHSKNDAFYIMPLGISLKDYLPNAKLKETFDIILKIIETIEFLHKNEITHRDIKIENLLMIDGAPKLSDFGLANFPKQVRVSRHNEKIGPAFTIAPEMRRISSTAEYKKADIYSLAKTIWVILTKDWLSFDGQYNNYSSIALSNYVDLYINRSHLFGETYFFSLVILEKLLSRATHNDPDKRPTIKEFKETFELWIESNANYQLRNNIEWVDAVEKVFPISIPETCIWTNISDIENVLKIIFSHYDSLNHCFFPVSGGLDFYSVEILELNGTKYLLINNSLLMKPKELVFESMNNQHWSYLRLELENQAPMFGLNVYIDEETLFIDEKRKIYDTRVEFTKEITLFLKGSFLIVQKASNINNLSGPFDHYGGLHNKLSNQDYKELVNKIIMSVQASALN